MPCSSPCRIVLSHVYTAPHLPGIPSLVPPPPCLLLFCADFLPFLARRLPRGCSPFAPPSAFTKFDRRFDVSRHAPGSQPHRYSSYSAHLWPRRSARSFFSHAPLPLSRAVVCRAPDSPGRRPRDSCFAQDICLSRLHGQSFLAGPGIRNPRGLLRRDRLDRLCVPNHVPEAAAVPGCDLVGPSLGPLAHSRHQFPWHRRPPRRLLASLFSGLRRRHDRHARAHLLAVRTDQERPLGPTHACLFDRCAGGLQPAGRQCASGGFLVRRLCRRSLAFSRCAVAFRTRLFGNLQPGPDQESLARPACLPIRLPCLKTPPPLDSSGFAAKTLQGRVLP